MITDSDICKEFLKSNNKINSPKIKNYILKRNYNEEIYDYLIKRYKDATDLNEIVYRIIHKIETLPKCLTCGKKLKYNTCHKFCSIKCAQNNVEVRNKNKLTFFKNFNTTEKKQELKNKKCKTFNEHYNTDEKRKELLNSRIKTNLEKYGIDYPLRLNEIKEKRKKTVNEKYGVDNVSKAKEIIKKIQKIRKEKNNEIIEKIKQTCLQKYGVDNVFKAKEIKEKIKQTCLQKYGVTHIMKLKEYSERIANSEIRKQHELETKRKNKTFNSSKTENESYQLLKQKYPDTIYQYRSKEYPFNCDFYIPSINTYIECNYHWTHGYHPYNPDNEKDKLLLEAWQSKNTEYYKNAITTWTIRDVNKRKIVKQNNLNYIEFWNINELINWVENFE